MKMFHIKSKDGIRLEEGFSKDLFADEKQKRYYFKIKSGNMYKVFLGTTLIASGLCYYLYQENQKLLGNVKSLEVAVQTQEQTINSLQNDFALQGQSLLDLQSKNQEIQLEMNRYLDIFKRHNLTKLAAAKPGLIEPRINKATKEVFDGIEEDSRDIDSADDGLQLQPPTSTDIRG